MATKAEKKALSDAAIAERVAEVQALADTKGFPPSYVELFQDILERLAVLEAKK
jgi:hypothetical protein